MLNVKLLVFWVSRCFIYGQMKYCKRFFIFICGYLEIKKIINIVRDGCLNNNLKLFSNKFIVQVDNLVYLCSNDKGRIERIIVIIISSYWMRLSML